MLCTILRIISRKSSLHVCSDTLRPLKTGHRMGSSRQAGNWRRGEKATRRCSEEGMSDSAHLLPSHFLCLALGSNYLRKTGVLAPHVFGEDRLRWRAQNMGCHDPFAIVTFLANPGSSLGLSFGLVTNLWANQAPLLSSSPY